MAFSCRFLTFISFGAGTRHGTRQMDIIKYDIYRGPNIGIYTKTNDEFVLIPNGFTKTKALALAEHLQVQYVNTSVANTRVIGTMAVLNNHGMLLPHTVYQDEVEFLQKTLDLNVEILDSRHNALGNLISANDKGAIVSPLLDGDDVKKIQQVLDVETIQSRIAGYDQTGVMISANSYGGIIHPEADEEDIKTFSNVLGVNLEPATINAGVPFLSSGILANNKCVIVGSFTTGPEIMMLTRAFIN